MKPIITLIVFLAFFQSVFANTVWHNGTLEGVITDTKSSKPLAGAAIVLSPSEAVTYSNELGYFSFRNLPAGEYKITITYVGYLPQTIDKIILQNAATTPVKIFLEPTGVDLPSVVVQATSDFATNLVEKIDLKTRPVNNAQELLTFIPGLFIAQHAGGGKAEQIFLRGFDLDHGTDINLSVDGMPVNMVSHAHGQGYADMHFIIPEIVDQIDYKKGPYYADLGDFATAGSARFSTANILEKSFVKTEVGKFDSYRLATGINLVNQEKQKAYVATEMMYSNGYFNAPQYFNRRNIWAKYSALLDNQQSLTLSFSSFASSWDASGQVPERAVNAGLISRFGSIDPTEGGITGRTNLNVQYARNISPGVFFKSQAYWTKYNFELYSNFTFFKRDSVNGDQIRQKENREIWGYNGSLHLDKTLAGLPWNSTFGVSVRYDDVRNIELSHTKQRDSTIGHAALGNIQQGTGSLYYDGQLWLSPNLNLNAGLRFDQFFFGYDDLLTPGYQLKVVTKNIASPKLNLTYKLSPRWQLMAHSGWGFHSNDTRVVTQQNGQQVLPRAFGAEVGTIFKPLPNLVAQLALWHLGLQQEFVYVGDEAIVEPSGRSSRQGFDLSLRLQLGKRFFADGNVNYAFARSIDEPEGQNRIPLAPIWTSTGGILFQPTKNWSLSLRYRYLGDRPANEDYSLTAKGYFLIDGQLQYSAGHFQGGFAFQNLLNRAWKEAQFATTSRLRNESEPVTEIHYTPGTPFYGKVFLSYRF